MLKRGWKAREISAVFKEWSTLNEGWEIVRQLKGLIPMTKEVEELLTMRSTKK